MVIADVQSVLFGLGFLLTLALIHRNPSSTNRLLCLFFLLSLLADYSQVLFKYLINPNYAASMYYILALPLLSCIYYLELGRVHRREFIIISIIYVVFAILNLLLIQRSSINSYTAIFFAVIIITYALTYFYWLIKELPTIHLQKMPMFWFNSAFIVYYSGNFFLFVFTSYLVNVLNNNLLMYWSLHNLLGISECLILIAGILVGFYNNRKMTF